MPLTESDISYKEMKDVIASRHNVCAECGGQLSMPWGGMFGYDSYILRCVKDITHTGYKREKKQSIHPGSHVGAIPIKEYKEMEKELGTMTTNSLVPYSTKTALTKADATEIIESLWGDAPPIEKAKAVALCVSYQLNPLMKHVYMVGYNKKDGQGNVIGQDWTMMLGIQATRLIASRKGRFSYIDNTPRLMREQEQMDIFGDLSTTHFRAIVKLRDEADGSTAQGYGVYSKANKPKGMEKGNTPQNMAFIRAERQALDRLRPGEMPQNIDTVDAEYEEVPNVGLVDKGTGEVIPDVEFREVTDESEMIPEPAPAPEPEPELEPTTKQLTLANLMTAMSDYAKAQFPDQGEDAMTKTRQAVGVFCKAKGWKVSKWDDLTVEHMGMLFNAMNNGEI